MISKQKGKYNWEFLFLGANIDSVDVASEIGIEESRALDYRADCVGMSVMYNTISKTVANLRNNGEIEENWQNDIQLDYNKSRL